MAKASRPVKTVAAGKKAITKRTAPKKAAAKKPPGPARKSSRMPVTDAETWEALVDVLGTNPELRTGSMFGCPGYFIGKKAVACMYGSEVCVTLPPAEIDRLVTTPGFRRFQPMGRTMSGWVLVDRQQITSPAVGPLLQQAIDYARSKAEAGSKKPRRR